MTMRVIHELPVPPGVPPELAIVFIAENPPLPKATIAYLRAAVYSQLWRKEATRLFASWGADGIESAYELALKNSELCAAEMRKEA